MDTGEEFVDDGGFDGVGVGGLEFAGMERCEIVEEDSFF